eukprot:10857081-Alexandrium_andersonii.AAC.1
MAGPPWGVRGGRSTYAKSAARLRPHCSVQASARRGSYGAAPPAHMYTLVSRAPIAKDCAECGL